MRATYFMVFLLLVSIFSLKLLFSWTNFHKQISYHCRKVYHVTSSVVSCWYLPDLYTKSDHKVTKFYYQVINCARYCVCKSMHNTSNNFTAHNHSHFCWLCIFVYQNRRGFFQRIEIILIRSESLKSVLLKTEITMFTAKFPVKLWPSEYPRSWGKWDWPL